MVVLKGWLEQGVTSKQVSSPNCGIACVTFSPAPSCRIPFESLLLSLPAADYPLCFFSLLGYFFSLHIMWILAKSFFS